MPQTVAPSRLGSGFLGPSTVEEEAPASRFHHPGPANPIAIPVPTILDCLHAIDYGSSLSVGAFPR